MKVRWVITKGGGCRVRESPEFSNEFSALAEFIRRENDPFVDRVDLISDKTGEYHDSPEALRDSLLSGDTE